MGFAKLDSNIVTSSVWAEDHETLRVWIYLLALADAAGRVRVTIPALAMQCGVTVQRAQAILDKFASPDPASRSPKNEGRRIRIDRDPEFAIVLLNHADYREKDYTHAARQRRYRERNAPRLRDGGVTASRDGGVTASDTRQKTEDRRNKKDLSAPEVPGSLSRSRNRFTYPEGFERWFAQYRQGTSNGRTKAEALSEWKKLPELDRASLEERTAAWLDRRARAGNAGLFVPAAKDPVRFLKGRRWEDEFDLPEAAPGATSENERLAEELSRYGSHPQWDEYRTLVVADRLPVGFDAFLASREAQP